ncbi:MAG: phosphoribosylamine--glycine ligase [Oscillospiraceae bacterium]|jgi:phosphoribosylamine--glycine ligase|nr:phosphoribosylamine--glycine ligase [Oscillospiraceae bacterium]
MTILLIGSGGREHAIATALAASPHTTKLFCAPGNGGIANVAECVNIAATDVAGVVDFAESHGVDLVFVASDDPLALGMVDALEKAGIRAFGPRQNAAIIESSKAFSKSFMAKYGIPTAAHATFSDCDAALAYIRERGAPIVVKADGLALGKGVIVAQTVAAAEEAVRSIMLDRRFGESGARVIIEEFMTGREVTVLAFTDGATVVPMLSSQDHKRVFDGDEGPNTGGMGAICPCPLYTETLAAQCVDMIFRPTIDGLRAEGREFRGVIYFEIMLTPQGPRVIEYNARFGDPEAQAVLPMLDTDLVDICNAVVDGRLAELPIRWKSGASCCVVMASEGYPSEYEKGRVISGLDDVPSDITVYHAGTKRDGDGYVTNGGRVLGVTARGDTLKAAIARAYDGVAAIRWDGAHFRRDIGHHALQK